MIFPLVIILENSYNRIILCTVYIKHYVHYVHYVLCKQCTSIVYQVRNLSIVQDLLGEIEAGKLETQENYWLIQYQKLMESKPAGVQTMERELDPQVE